MTARKSTRPFDAAAAERRWRMGLIDDNGKADGRTSRAEKKPSIRVEMKSLQAEIAARDAAKQKEKQPQEAVL